MHIVHGRKLGLAARGTTHAAVRLNSGGSASRRVHAIWVDQAVDEVRDGERQKELLVAHRRGIIDVEEDVDLVDDLILNPGVEPRVGLRSRRDWRTCVILATWPDERTCVALRGRSHGVAQPADGGSPRTARPCTARPRVGTRLAPTPG